MRFHENSKFNNLFTAVDDGFSVSLNEGSQLPKNVHIFVYVWWVKMEKDILQTESSWIPTQVDARRLRDQSQHIDIAECVEQRTKENYIPTTKFTSLRDSLAPPMSIFFHSSSRQTTDRVQLEPVSQPNRSTRHCTYDFYVVPTYIQRPNIVTSSSLHFSSLSHSPPWFSPAFALCSVAELYVVNGVAVYAENIYICTRGENKNNTLSHEEGDCVCMCTRGVKGRKKM